MYRTITADILVVVTVRTTLSCLNRQAIASHITNDMRHDAGDSDIIQSLAFNRFAVFSNQRPPSQRGKLRPAAVLDKNLTTFIVIFN